MPGENREHSRQQSGTAAHSRLQRACQLHQRGQLAQAEALYKEVLQADPRQPDALQLLGVIALQSGRRAEGMALLQRSLDVYPNQPMAQANLGVALLDSNRPEEALACLKMALRLQPDLVLAHENQGRALLALSRPHEALESFDTVLRLQPRAPEACNARGNVLKQLGAYPQALESYAQAIKLSPGMAEAWNNHGAVLLDLDRPAEALASLDHALLLKPASALAHSNRGTALRALKLLDQALVSFDRAVELDRSCVEAWYNRGSALRDLKRYEEALASYDRALALRPGFAEAHNNRGYTLLYLKRPEEALDSLDRALQLKPDDLETLNNRGNALRELRRPEQALQTFAQALSIRSDYAEAYNNGSVALQDLHRLPEALASCDRALALKPDLVQGLNNRGGILLDMQQHESAAECFAKLLAIDPHFTFAPAKLLQSKLHCCDWTDYAQSIRSIAAGESRGDFAHIPFLFLALTDSAAAQLTCMQTFIAGQHFEDRSSLAPRQPESRDRIRVAYVSTDLRDHAVSYLMAGVWEKHDRRRFEIIAISLRAADSSAMGQRVTSAFDRFIDVSGMSDAECAATMRSLEIDIAVDLMGYTSGCRPMIFAHRSAPVQINYLGFPGTMGIGSMDYILADPFLVPRTTATSYVEHIAYLPDCFQANDDARRDSGTVPTRRSAGLPDQGIVWCSFNNSYKLNPAMFDIWMRLLQQVPGSVLWLVARHEAVKHNLRKEAECRGVDSSRLVFCGHLPYPEHLSRLQLADIFLDTLPFNAGTTASDALWAGVPIVTCAGEALAARMAGSLLHACDLPELVTSSLAEYEAVALRLANSQDRNAGIRAKLLAQRSTGRLFDTARFTRYLEAAYTLMWERAQRGEPPETFAVPA